MEHKQIPETLEEDNDRFKEILKQPKYAPLRQNTQLGKNIIAFMCGGSYAHGCTVDTSDIDFIGIHAYTPKQIFLGEISSDKEVLYEHQDFLSYSLYQAAQKLLKTNVHLFELMFFDRRFFLVYSDLIDIIRNNISAYLSKEVYFTFLSTILDISSKQEKTALRNMPAWFPERCNNLEMNKVLKPARYENGLILNLSMNGVSPDQFSSFSNNVYQARNYYYKFGRMDQKKDYKVCSYAHHTVRLMHNVEELLRNGDYNPYIENGQMRSILKQIKQGDFLVDGALTKEYFDVAFEQVAKADEAYRASKLPEQPDYKRINEITAEVNRKIVLGDYDIYGKIFIEE